MKLKPLVLALLAAGAAPAFSQISGDTVRIGMITDLSGPYIDVDGPGGAEAIRMAIADFGGTVNGKKIELVVADHQNKTDIAIAKAKEWFDTTGMDVLFGGGASASALGMAHAAAERKKPFIVNGAGSTRLTNEECTPYTVHYAYDTMSLAKVAGSAIVKQGGKDWYFLALDTAFGASTQAETSEVVKQNGGTTVGVSRHPANVTDFSAFMLKAQQSKAHVLALANAGSDTVNAIKSANEFGLTKNMKLAGLLMFIADVHALGLGQTQGMYLTDNWYWDQSPESRTWSRRFYEKMKKMPSGVQAAQYSAAMHYLQAVKAAGTDDGDAVMAQMKKARINDMYAKGGWIREDGRMMHEMYLMQVKSPAESKYPWDYYKVVGKVPAEQAFTTRAESRCTVWK